MNIRVLTAGGTIDKIYSDAKGTLNFSFGGSAFIDLVTRNSRLNFKYKVQSLLPKDSLDMTDEDRNLIRKICETCAEDKILITHGTDTVVDTARVLVGIPSKLIILTGASQPFRFRESDAEFNIGVAVGALNTLKRGVYIAMNGRVYKWNACHKLPDGRYVEK